MSANALEMVRTLRAAAERASGGAFGGYVLRLGPRAFEAIRTCLGLETADQVAAAIGCERVIVERPIARRAQPGAAQPNRAARRGAARGGRRRCR